MGHLQHLLVYSTPPPEMAPRSSVYTSSPHNSPQLDTHNAQLMHMWIPSKLRTHLTPLVVAVDDSLDCHHRPACAVIMLQNGHVIVPWAYGRNILHRSSESKIYKKISQVSATKENGREANKRIIKRSKQIIQTESVQLKKKGGENKRSYHTEKKIEVARSAYLEE